jgi:hypothetical protein
MQCASMGAQIASLLAQSDVITAAIDVLWSGV